MLVELQPFFDIFEPLLLRHGVGLSLLPLRILARPVCSVRCHSRRLSALEQFLAGSGLLLARSMFRDAGQIMDDDDDARRSQKFVLTIIRVIILVALISYAIWILLSAFASTKR